MKKSIPHLAPYLAPLLALLLLPGCLHVSSNKTYGPATNLPAANIATSSPTSSWLRTELFFGLSRPNGPLISDAEFQHFADTVIAPRFPSGFTILPARGYWQGQSAPLNEPSKVVVILHPPSPDASLKITDICKTYAQTFNQEAVLRSTSAAEVQFISK